MTKIRRLSFVLLIIVSLSFSAYTTYTSLRHFRPNAGEQNEVSVWENRMQPIREKLPPDVTEVGYLAEWDIPGATYGQTDQYHEFNLTVYSMAPYIVRRGAEHDWVLGNFGNVLIKKIDPWLRASLGNYEIVATSSGLYLMHQVKP